MNILHCPNCAGDIIINVVYTLRYTKEIVLTKGVNSAVNRSDSCHRQLDLNKINSDRKEK